VVEVSRTRGHLDHVAQLLILQAEVAVEVEDGVHALQAGLDVLLVFVVFEEVSDL
jgi:hypothetical protein